MVRQIKPIPSLPEVPLYAEEWEGQRRFMAAIRQRVEALTPDPTQPSAVTVFTVTTRSTSGAVEINWEPTSNANSYRIYRNTVRDFTSASVVAEVFGTSTKRFVDNVLVAGTYFYWITGVNLLGKEGPILDLTGIAGATISPAPVDAEYIVASSNPTLTNERVIQNTASITFDTATAGILKAVRAALSGDISASADSNTTAIGSNKVLTTHIADDQITTSKILANAVTADKISVSQLSAISADMGHITAGDIVISSGGFIRSGQTAYDDGTGFWQGNVSGTPKFSIGNSAGNKLTFDGTNVNVVGTITGSLISASTFQTGSSGERVVIDGSNGITVYNSSDILVAQLWPSTFEGLTVNLIKGLNSTFLIYSSDQNAFIRVDGSVPEVLFGTNGSGQVGSFDDGYGGGGGSEWSTSLVIRTRNGVKRVNQAENSHGAGKGFLWCDN